MSNVRGPFIEYDCIKCGFVVQLRAHRKLDKLADQIAHLNNNSHERICAPCWQPKEQHRNDDADI